MAGEAEEKEVQEELEEEPEVTEPDEKEVKEPEDPTIEDLAREQGWKPSDDFTGHEDDYVGPVEYIRRGKDIQDTMRKHLKDKNVFCIPHFGGRKGNPDFHDPKVQRMIEIFSEHRRSEDWATTYLTRGRRLGIMASTDGHFGNPGHGYLKPSYDWEHQEIGMAALALRAPAHSHRQ